MKKALAILDKLLHPPKWVLISVPPIVFTVLIFFFINGENHSVSAYTVYCMSAYCLLIWSIPVPKLIKRTKYAVMKKLTRSYFWGKYVSDPVFRGGVGIYQGMTVNFLYVIFRVVVGVRYASVWSISMAAYYLMLGALRLYLILNYRHRKNENELRCYRKTASMLFLLNIPMGGMILLMIQTDSGYSYPGYIIYASAIYTFYTMIHSVMNLVKYRKLGSPLLSAAKVLNFVAALMSVIGLQTAMITHFSADEENFRKIMNTVTGTAIWCAVIITAVFMLLRGRKIKSEVNSFEQIRK